MPEPWFKPLVWMDYRLAVLFTIVIPLILLIWAFVQKSEAIARLLIIYWRVASLGAIALYLMIAALPIAFAANASARILIPISLWFWVDLNEEIDDLQPSSLKLTLRAWRWAITVYSVLGTLFFLPFLGCAVSTAQQIKSNPFCRVWLDPAWLYKLYFHGGENNQGVNSEGFLGFVGIVGLLIYVAYFSYFVLIRLGKQGRSATGH